MPSGVYERKPYMKTYGKTTGKNIEAMVRKMGVKETAKQIGVSHRQVYAVLREQREKAA